MAKDRVQPTGREVTFRDDEFIVSKTDTKGVITYANDVFCRVSGYTEAELLGRPHSIVRHPDMPRCAYKLVWETLESGSEVFAYVINLCKTGDHYWVLAHMTPSLDERGRLVGYHSNRRKPARHAVEAAAALYKDLRAIEQRPANRKDGMQAGFDHLLHTLTSQGIGYDRFVLSL